MKNTILILTVCTGSLFAASSSDISQDLVSQIKWRGAKTEKGLNCGILRSEIRRELCCLGYANLCCRHTSESDVIERAEDYLKNQVLELDGKPLAQSPYCDGLYAELVQKHAVRFERIKSHEEGWWYMRGILGLSLLEGCGALAVGITVDYPEETVYCGAGMLVASIAPLTRAIQICGLRLKGSLEDIPDADKNGESKKDR